MAVFAIIILPLLYLLYPVWRLKFGALYGDRIGHLAGNTELFIRLRNRDGWPKRTTNIFVVRNAANQQLLKMWKRQLLVQDGRFWYRLYDSTLPILSRTRFYEALPDIPVDWSTIQYIGRPSLAFDAAEEKRGRALFEQMGIGTSDWFVCFHSRDPSYLEKRTGFGTGRRVSTFFDSSIVNYQAAMRWVASKGGFAVRMGQAVDEALQNVEPNIVDYALRHRTDFHDIYVPSKCRFFIGSNSGLFYAAYIFGVPVALANVCPLPFFGNGGGTVLNIPKLLRRKSDGRILTFPEIRDMGLLECYRDELDRLRVLFDGATYEKLGLEWVENEPEDILGLTMDMMDKIEGRAPPPEAVELQRAFRALYVRAYDGPLAGGIGPRFALRHAHLIAPDKYASPASPRLRETA